MASINGLLTFLYEDSDPDLPVMAMEQLDKHVMLFWAQIGEHLPRLIELHDDETFTGRERTALLISKLYYCLGSFDVAVDYAIQAGSLFDMNEDSLYMQTILACFVEQYLENKRAGEGVPDHLETFVRDMFESCCSNDPTTAFGLALECGSLEMVNRVLDLAEDRRAALRELASIADLGASSIELRHNVLRLVSEQLQAYHEMAQDGYVEDLTLCAELHQSMGEAEAIAPVIAHTATHMPLLGLQICFSLVETSTKAFRKRVGLILASLATEQTDSTIEQFTTILDGRFTTGLRMRLLHAAYAGDLNILTEIQNNCSSRDHILRNAAFLANALMHAGTTIDPFLRKNLKFMDMNKLWSRANSFASLGVVHMGQLAKSRHLLSKFLPEPQEMKSDTYASSGALLALGLIHQNAGDDEQINYLREILSWLSEISDGQERKRALPMLFGACLGLGTIAMGTYDFDLIELFKTVMYSDAAVPGQAASIAVGLILTGVMVEESPSQQLLSLIDEMAKYIVNTPFAKVARGLSIGLALILMGSEDRALSYITEWLADSNDHLRYAATLAMGTAFNGTSNNEILEKLLHVAVSDLNDDVRRVSIVSIAFVMCRAPESLPRILKLLARSYNPHVRFGVALALGMVCAGSGDNDAFRLVQPLTKDSEDFVRQGAFISIGMLLQQRSAKNDARVLQTQSMLLDIIRDDREASLAKLGAALGLGMMDAGGRNSVFKLTMPVAGKTQVLRQSIVGALIGSHFWYWHSYTLFFSLCLVPTGLVAVTTQESQIQVPIVKVDCTTRPSEFAVAEPYVPKKRQIKVTGERAVLSDAKRQARLNRLKSPSDEDEISQEESAEHVSEADEPVAPPLEPVEPDRFELSLPGRITISQREFIDFPEDGRFFPVDSTKRMGVIVMEDRAPDEEMEHAFITKS